MKFIKNIKGFLYKTDFFYTTQLLRYKDQPQYRTLFGGFLSLLIIIGLIVMFYNKFVDTLDKVIINSVTGNTNAADPPEFKISTFTQDKFMFGVQIWHHDLNTGLRYFDVVLTSAQFDTGQRRPTSMQYPLQPCQLSHWQGFPEVQSEYSRLSMNYWLCLPKNSTYNIKGKYASNFSQTLQVAVKKCTNASDPSRPCADQATIDQFFVDNGPFFFTIYFINPLINPNSQKYLTFYLQDNNYIIFTERFGSEGVLFMEEYQITTDQSILPFTQVHQNKGGVVTQFALKNPYQITPNADVYCSFAFFKSGMNRKYNRQFQKLDQILSYIGGLFGTIAIALFIVNMYNTNSFQITLGGSLFQSKNKKQKSSLKGYHFFNFMSHLFYSCFDSIGFTPNWQKVRKYDDYRQQMKKQLDIRYLLERVFFLQKSIKYLFEDYQLKGLHLHKKLTLQQAKTNRKNFKIKRKILKATQQIKNNNFTSNTNPTQQSMDVIDTKIYDLHALNALYQTKTAVNRIKEDQAYRNNIKPKQKRFDLNQKDSLSSDSSSDQQKYNDDSISKEIKKLKIQSEKGDMLSLKIWQNIDQSIKDSIQFLKLKQKKENKINLQNLSDSKNIKPKKKKLQTYKIANLYAENQVYDKNIQFSQDQDKSNLQSSSNKKLILDKNLQAIKIKNLQLESSSNQLSSIHQNQQYMQNQYKQRQNVLVEDQMEDGSRSTH